MAKRKFCLAAISFLSLSLGLVPAMAQDSTEPGSAEDSRIMHVLNRITFGPRPGDFAEVKKLGVQKFISQQLDPASLKEAPEVADYVANHQSLGMSTGELFQNYGRPVVKAALQNQLGEKTAESKKEINKVVAANYRKVIGDVSGEHIARALFTPRQLEEVMTDFWFNHFNVSQDKGFDHIWVGNFEDQAIRPYALGNFRDLLEATAHHPAMLFYLDNWQNAAPQSPNRPLAAMLANGKGKGKKQGINENFARELMELHTLGVDGGYTQQDVIALAHILTGLGLPPLRQDIGTADVTASGQSGYRFYPQRHDPTPQTLLGVQINGSGEQEIENALDLLANHPQTAHHISYQLCQYFITDTPPESCVDACAATFQKTHGDIKSVLRTLFAQKEFWDDRYTNSKFKSPQRYIISSLRASDIVPSNFYPFLGYLKQAGQPLYGCLTPDGYKNTKDAWLNPDGLIKRINIATALGVGKMPGAIGSKADPTVVMDAIGKELKPNTLEVAAKAPSQMKAAMLLGSPEFMKY
jgi:uncharacterized protein (DUF1800 family)